VEILFVLAVLLLLLVVGLKPELFLESFPRRTTQRQVEPPPQREEARTADYSFSFPARPQRR
jgi:hypothetical protein